LEFAPKEMTAIAFELSPNCRCHFEIEDATDIRDYQKLRDGRSIQLLKQVHGAEGYLAEDLKERLRGDWLWTTQKNFPIGVFVADCTAVLMHGKSAGRDFIAAIHAGWRGTAQRILEKALLKIGETSELKAWLSPSICQECYEVSDEVVEELGAQDYVLPSEPGHAYLDLKRFQIDRLGKLDVEVFSSSLCTDEQPEFFSYRQMKGDLKARHLAWLELL
jgi:YfiH family protein